MTRIRDALDLDSIPAPSTLCKAFDRLEMAVWRVLLNASFATFPVNGVTGIDASGFERAHASTHYTQRTNLTIQQLKTTLLVDTATNVVLNIHVTTCKHDTQLWWKLFRELLIKCIVYNLERGLAISHEECDCS